MRCRRFKYLIQDCNDVNCDIVILRCAGFPAVWMYHVTKHVICNIPLEIRGNISTRTHAQHAHTHTHARHEARRHLVLVCNNNNKKEKTHTRTERGGIIGGILGARREGIFGIRHEELLDQLSKNVKFRKPKLHTAVMQKFMSQTRIMKWPEVILQPKSKFGGIWRQTISWRWTSENVCAEPE